MKLLEFINSHDNWRQLLSESPYNLRFDETDEYILLKYNMIDSDFSLPEVLDARGIIINKRTLKPVCIPFYKFFNYGEPYAAAIDWATASVQEKVDGSLIKVWFDHKWHISSNGAIDAFKYPLPGNNIFFNSLGELFKAALPFDFEKLCSLLNPKYTYMFELVSPYTRVVISYDKPDVYFLGCRHNETFQEYFPEQVELSKYIKIPKRYKLTSLQAVIDAAKKLGADQEGYVVCDKAFNRVKIKSPLYIAAHYLRATSTPSYKTLMEIILAGEESEFLAYNPEYTDLVNRLKAAQVGVKAEIRVKLAELNPQQYKNRREYAEQVNKAQSWQQPFLFAYDKLDSMYTNLTAAKWIEVFNKSGYFRT